MNVRVTVGRVLTYLTIGAGTLLAMGVLPVSALIATSVLVVPVAVAAATLRRVRAAAATLGGVSLPGSTVLIGAMLLSLIGGTAVLGLSGAVVVGGALAGGVYLCRPARGTTSGVHRDATGRRTVGGSGAAVSEAPPEIGAPRQRLREASTLSDTELCEAWRISYLFITRVSDPDSVDRIARMRREYLDEIQRRDPAGFDRWIDSGARAASNPRPFLTNARRPD